MKNNIYFFMTFGISLEEWKRRGMLTREIAFLKHLKEVNKSANINLFSYSHNDIEIANEIARDDNFKINIIAPKTELKGKAHKFFFSIAKIFLIKQQSHQNLLITNQLKGSWSALMFKLIKGGKLITRTGYTLSRFSYKKRGFSFRYVLILFYEVLMQMLSDRYIVSSLSDKNYFKNILFSPQKKISIAKNYVETINFKLVPRADEILFVGRLTEQKNLISIIEACIESDTKLSIIGDGELLSYVKAKTAQSNLIKYLGSQPHKVVLSEMQRCKYYIMASFYEGMPKTFLEALSCKCLCIASNISAVKEFSLEDKAIILDGFGRDAIKKGINEAKSKNANEYLSIIEKGSEYVRKYHSIASFSRDVLGG